MDQLARQFPLHDANTEAEETHNLPALFAGVSMLVYQLNLRGLRIMLNICSREITLQILRPVVEGKACITADDLLASEATVKTRFRDDFLTYVYFQQTLSVTASSQVTQRVFARWNRLLWQLDQHAESFICRIAPESVALR